MVEVDDAPGWRKSSRSGNTSCVEFTCSSSAAFVRDSKDVTGPALRFGRRSWIDFVNGLKAGAFDGAASAPGSTFSEERQVGPRG
jgi:hypothetical protein